jgi:GAF domain-containing protein
MGSCQELHQETGEARMVNTTRSKNGKGKQGRNVLAVRRQIAIQKALYEIATAASAVTEMRSFYRRLHEIVGELMYARNFFIATYDHQSDLITWEYYMDTVDVAPPAPISLSRQRGSTGWILRHGETLADVDGSVARAMKSGEIELVGTVSDGIGVPLRNENKPIGVLVVQSYEEAIQYTLEDIEILTFVAQHISTALARARATEETRQRNQELQVINSVQQGLASNLDIQSIYTLVGDKLREIFAADTTFIAFRDDAKRVLHVHYYADRVLRRSFSRPYRTGIAEVIIESGHPLLLRTELEQKEYGALHVVSPGAEKDRNQSVLGVPIFRDGKAYGAVTVQSYKANAFDENALRLLQTLVNSMSVALENARLFSETQQRNAELAIINRVQEGLASKLDMQAIYELVGEKIRSTFNAQVVNIVTYDRATQLLSGRYYFEDGKVLPGVTLPVFGFRKHVIETCQPIVINKDMPRWVQEYDNPVLLGLQPKSAVFIPMIVGKEAMGVISLQNNDQENAFTEADVRLLTMLANSMSVALENARLFDETQSLLKETQQRNAELAIINSVQAGLASQLDIQAIYELVGDKIREIFDANTVVLATFDIQENLMFRHYVIEQGKRYQVEPTPIPAVWNGFIQRGQSTLINTNLLEFLRGIDPAFEALVGEIPKCALSVPLRLQDEIRGVISLQNVDRENAFSESDMRLLETLANSLSVALDNARLFDETQRLFHAEQRAHEQAETLRSVAQALNRSLSLTEVFHLVLTEIQKVIPYDSAGIYRVQGDRRVFVAGRGFANLEDLIGVSFELNPQEDEIGYLISRSLQPLILEDAPEKYPQYFSTGTHAATKIRSYLAVPIVLNQKLIGMITLDREDPGFYTDEHARLAMAFAAQAATAINNAQLFDETQQRNAELAIINTVQEGLASKLDLQAIYELVGDKIRDVFDAQAVIIVSYDHATEAVDFNYIFEKGRQFFADPIPFTKMTRQLIHTREFVLINEGVEQHFLKYGIQPAPGTSLGKSVLWMPLIVDNAVGGAINLYNLDHEYAFSESDVRLLQTLANSMSVALENARLWEQEKLYRKTLERELEIGREIQAGFLPEELPAIEGWEIAASLMPAREVAGDFYDAFELPDGNIGLVIADVCDKGVGAALFMTLFRSLIRITANQDYFERKESDGASYFTAGRLQRAMMLTNNYIAETHQASGMFATLFFGILDPQAGRLMYINGGHEPPLIVESGQVRESLRKSGPAVGAVWGGQFDVRIVELKPGDTLFAFTDGAPEAKEPRGEFFGRERLFQILRRCNDSSHELIQTIEAELHRYMDGATQFDDITLLALKRVR